MKKLRRLRKASKIKPPTLDIPPIVVECTTWLTQHALCEEGLFRVSANKTELDALMKAYRKRGELRLASRARVDPHLVAGCLKQFVRDLESSLLVSALADVWIRAAKVGGGPDAQLAALQAVVDLLPLANRAMASHIFQFLHSVAAHAAQNRMTANNLAIVFGPNLLTPGSYSLADAGAVVQIALVAIERPKQLFEVRDERAPRLTPELRTSMRRASRLIMLSEMAKTDVYEGVVSAEFRPKAHSARSGVESVYVNLPDLSGGGGNDGDDADTDGAPDYASVATPRAEHVERRDDDSGVWRLPPTAATDAASAAEPVHAVAWSAPHARDWPLLDASRGSALATVRLQVMSAARRITIVCDTTASVNSVLLQLAGMLIKLRVLPATIAAEAGAADGNGQAKRFEWTMHTSDENGVTTRVSPDTPLGLVLPPSGVEWPRLMLLREEAASAQAHGQTRVKQRMRKRMQNMVTRSDSGDQMRSAAHSKPLPAAKARSASHSTRPTSETPLGDAALARERAKRLGNGGAKVLLRHDSAPNQLRPGSADSNKTPSPSPLARQSGSGSGMASPAAKSPMLSPRSRRVRFPQKPTADAPTPTLLARRKARNSLHVQSSPPMSPVLSREKRYSADTTNSSPRNSLTSSLGSMSIIDEEDANALESSDEIASEAPQANAVTDAEKSEATTETESKVVEHDEMAGGDDVGENSGAADNSSAADDSDVPHERSAAQRVGAARGADETLAVSSAAARLRLHKPNHLSAASSVVSDSGSSHKSTASREPLASSLKTLSSSSTSTSSSLASMTLPRSLPSQDAYTIAPLNLGNSRAVDLERAELEKKDVALKFSVEELYELVLNLKAAAVQMYISQLDEDERVEVKSELHKMLMNEATDEANDVDDDIDSESANSSVHGDSGVFSLEAE